MSRIVFISGKAKSDKMSQPKQARIVMMHIAKSCNMTLNTATTMEAVIASIDASGELDTVQSTKRIVSYYLPLLREQGFIKYESARSESLVIETK